MVKIFSFVLLVSSCFGQTKVELNKQVAAPAAADAVIIMSLPGLGYTPVRLDANSLELVVSQTGLFLRAKAKNQDFQEDFFKLNQTQTVFTTSKVVSGPKSNITIFKNGLLQREIEDYAIEENGGIWNITFKSPQEIGTFITIRYPTNN